MVFEILFVKALETEPLLQCYFQLVSTWKFFKLVTPPQPMLSLAEQPGLWRWAPTSFLMVFCSRCILRHSFDFFCFSSWIINEVLKFTYNRYRDIPQVICRVILEKVIMRTSNTGNCIFRRKRKEGVKLPVWKSLTANKIAPTYSTTQAKLNVFLSLWLFCKLWQIYFSLTVKYTKPFIREF